MSRSGSFPSTSIPPGIRGKIRLGIRSDRLPAGDNSTRQAVADTGEASNRFRRPMEVPAAVSD